MSPEDIPHDPATIYVNEFSDTVGTGRIQRMSDGKWLVRWAPGITCESTVDDVPAGAMSLLVEVPGSVQSGDVFDIEEPNHTSSEMAFALVEFHDTSSAPGYFFRRGTIVVDSWGPEGGTLRVWASDGYAGIEGSIQATRCPDPIE